MILPALDVPRLPIRPPLNRPPVLCRIIIHVFSGLIWPCYVWGWRSRAHRCREIQKAIASCASRDALEAMMGRPRYSLDGAGFRYSSPDAESIVPDFVEVYQAHGCQLEFWFEGGKGTLRIVMPEITWWDCLIGQSYTVVWAPMNCDQAMSNSVPNPEHPDCRFWIGPFPQS